MSEDVFFPWGSFPKKEAGPVSEAVKNAFDLAKDEVLAFEKDMDMRAKVTELAPEMLSILKDIAGGSYSEQEAIKMAQEIVNKAEGRA